jgi:hypothetical protein
MFLLRFRPDELERNLRTRLMDSRVKEVEVFHQRGCATWVDAIGQDPKVSLVTVP